MIILAGAEGSARVTVESLQDGDREQVRVTDAVHS
jgi:hypothetical protein